MPIYAYRCAACGFEQDALQKMSDAPLSLCPNCGQPELKKQVTAAGFQLKGSGWYVTDFRDGAKKAKAADAAKPGAEAAAGEANTGDGAAAKSESSPAGESAAAAPAPSESKPAATSPASAPAPSGGNAAGTGGKSGPSAPCSSHHCC